MLSREIVRGGPSAREEQQQNMEEDERGDEDDNDDDGEGETTTTTAILTWPVSVEDLSAAAVGSEVGMSSKML